MNHYEVDVSLLGKTFSFTLPDSLDKQRFYDIVDYTENKLKNIRAEMDKLDHFKTALLAALNISEELFALRDENQKLKALLSRIDKTLDECEADESLSIRLGGMQS
jgi:cell division protein ZapA (FtsZ GTPase activity inhibitor)